MLYVDTCVLLAALTPEANSDIAAAFLGQATAQLAIASGRGAILCSLDAPFVMAAQQLGLNAQLIGADATSIEI